MNFRTEINLAASSIQLDYNSKILLLGSCFAENIGEKLNYFRFQTEINPCGIIYNPLSVANVLKLLLDKRFFLESDLLYNNGKWVSLYHHGSFSAIQKEVSLRQINSRLESAREKMKESDILLITFGTAWVYRHKLSGTIAANCHKFPAADFERFRLTPEDIVNEYRILISRLRKENPNLKIVFTVSPIRHWKDGAHGNQLSKSVLLLAIDELLQTEPNTYYFPSYEIVMDELRDYRFYTEDMLHPSTTAIDYIWEKFSKTWMTTSTELLMKRIDKLNKNLLHRPFTPESSEYQKFRENIRQEIGSLLEENQNIVFSSTELSTVS